MMNISLFAIGVCKSNPGRGAWSYLAAHHESGDEDIAYGHDDFTTPNKILLTGLIRGINNITSNYRITIYFDNQFVYDGLNKHMKDWRRNGWISQVTKEEIKNSKEWSRLDEALSTKEYTVRRASDYPETYRYMNRLKDFCKAELV